MKQNEHLILNEMNPRGIRKRLIELRAKLRAVDRAIDALQCLDAEYPGREAPSIDFCEKKPRCRPRLKVTYGAARQRSKNWKILAHMG